jgi:pectinesterase
MKVIVVLVCASAWCAFPMFAADRELSVGAGAQYATVQAAVDAAAPHSVIHIRPGIYKERVVVPYQKAFLTFRGDDAKATVITFDSHAGLPGPKGPINTFATPTVFIQANDFTAENLTFENSAGNVGQAVALTIMGDRGVFRNCRFLGYQDTLLPQAGRQLFERCYIEGATDFIFGGSAAYFDHCTIHATANGYLTAANTTKDQVFGYVFDHCIITGAPNVKTYLGRPWRPYAATVFLNSEISGVMRPEGWNNWNDPAREKTVRYAEYPAPEGRVPWARALTAAEAAGYSMDKVLGGIDTWNPRTGEVARAIHFAQGMSAKLPPAGRYRNVIKAHDGLFHAVWADEKRLAHATSKDQEHWSATQTFDVMAGLNALDLESPNVFYDEAGKQFVVTWSCTLARNAIQAFQEDVEHNPRIWYATTRDFAKFSESKLLFDNNYAVRDAQILKLDGRYALLHTDSTWPMQNLRVAFSASPVGPWGPSTDAITGKGTHSPHAVLSGGFWWIYHSGGLVRSRDFWTFVELPLPAGTPPVTAFEGSRVSAPPTRQ